MKDIIVVYPKKETALSLRSLIEKNGFHVTHICALGSSALEIAHEKQSGIIVCPFLMRDITAAELAEQVPPGFDIIALSKNGSEQYMGNLITLPVPMDREDFLNTVHMLASSKSSFTRRTGEDGEYISKAKEALMHIKGMSETQAHKYLQQQSMKSGKKIAAAAMDILDSLT
ncbi:MAG TPA: ANTAR domain-containing protein [Candidatus Eubacterium faecipullorum]|uniref:ANTAR domain-containing protein n=1 Tax=Candidatus Eubacterium faecipullorum TaxID=2838571 RepID=A0A9D1UF19_9FIRM|nr:ANTAR domain-containing protein [Candidatus Eubacterium faecipullorum]